MHTLTSIIETYLRERPTFYAYLRPQEAMLFYDRIKKMKGPLLDFGCGDGFFAKTFLKKKSIDVGLDLASSRMAQAPATKIYKKLVEYDGISIPYRAGTFGTIISNCVFEHIPDIEKSVQELYRVNKKGGLLMTTVMCNSWSSNLVGAKLFGKIYSDWFNGFQQHNSLLSKKEWAKLFKKTGYEVVEAIDYLYEKAAHKTEVYHFLSLFSLLTYILLKRWQLVPFVSKKRIEEIQNLIQSDHKNPSACFFVLKKR